MTPTQRTIRELKNRGQVCAIVEKWNAYAGIRQDMFGIIDIIALDPVRGVIGVQSTGQAFSEHYKKLTQEKAQQTMDWLNTPGTVLELWGWRKIKAKKGGKAEIWAPRLAVITLADLVDKDYLQ